MEHKSWADLYVFINIHVELFWNAEISDWIIDYFYAYRIIEGFQVCSGMRCIFLFLFISYN